MSRETFLKLALDYLVIGDCYVQQVTTGGSLFRASLVSCLEENVADPRSSSDRRTPMFPAPNQYPVPR